VNSESPSSAVTTARVIRHRGPDRLYHWFMAASVLILLGTAFLPIVGWKFDWINAHWIAGVVLTGLVVVHVIRATIWLDIWSMMIWPRDLLEAWAAVRYELRAKASPPPLPGKYSLMQRGYHVCIAVTVLATIVTGVMMMAKIDTPFWLRNPYWLSQDTWGIIYIIHDLAAMLLLALIMIHIYLGLRPEKLWITRSMIIGWITGANYAAHYDPARWEAERGAGE
jgi:formate dehydrogenase subunit gamma